MLITFFRPEVRNQFLEQLADEVDPSIPTLLYSDFNTVFDRNLDRSGSDSSDTWRESSAALMTLFQSCCCIDAWRYLHPTSAGFSWTRPDGLISSRIDLIDCPYIWVFSMSSCDFVSCPYSDHCALLFSVFVPGIVLPGDNPFFFVLAWVSVSILSSGSSGHLCWLHSSQSLLGWLCLRVLMLVLVSVHLVLFALYGIWASVF